MHSIEKPCTYNIFNVKNALFHQAKTRLSFMAFTRQHELISCARVKTTIFNNEAKQSSKVTQNAHAMYLKHVLLPYLPYDVSF